MAVLGNVGVFGLFGLKKAQHRHLRAVQVGRPFGDDASKSALIEETQLRTSGGPTRIRYLKREKENKRTKI
jgi:hypothetical protein